MCEEGYFYVVSGNYGKFAVDMVRVATVGMRWKALNLTEFVAS